LPTRIGVPRRRSIRQLLFGKAPHVYRVLFVVVNDEVRVLRIRHAARKGLDPRDRASS